MDSQPRRLPSRYVVGLNPIVNRRLLISTFFNAYLVLASRTHTGAWSATFVTAPHDGNNRSEVLRIRNQHPGEPECLEDNRIVGFLGPTRCEHFYGFYVRIGNFQSYSKVDTRAHLQLSAIRGSNCRPSFLSAFFSIFAESGTYSDPRPTSPA